MSSIWHLFSSFCLESIFLLFFAAPNIGKNFNCSYNFLKLLHYFFQSRLYAGELLDIVASHFNIKEKEYFGIAYIDDRYVYILIFFIFCSNVLLLTICTIFLTKASADFSTVFCSNFLYTCMCSMKFPSTDYLLVEIHKHGYKKFQQNTVLKSALVIKPLIKKSSSTLHSEMEQKVKKNG